MRRRTKEDLEMFAFGLLVPGIALGIAQMVILHAFQSYMTSVYTRGTYTTIVIIASLVGGGLYQLMALGVITNQCESDSLNAAGVFLIIVISYSYIILNIVLVLSNLTDILLFLWISAVPIFFGFLGLFYLVWEMVMNS